jgi:hypothetical protein
MLHLYRRKVNDRGRARQGRASSVYRCDSGSMTITLNTEALANAEKLIAAGRATHDDRDDWSEHAPSAAKENEFIEKNGYAEYAKWHLGVDKSASEDTKGRYSFPFGDFAGVHRCGLIAAESRAAQNDHGSIAAAAKSLLEKIDA